MSVTTSAAVKTVVVADDTAFVRDRFKMALEGAGHRVLVARTAAELLTLVRGQHDDLHLIAVDLRLPHGHGLQILRSLRRLNISLPPIVVFSGTIANAAEVHELGALQVAGFINEYTATQHIVPALAPYLFPDRCTRRSSPRVSLAIPVSYRFGNTIASALTMNISAGGLALRTTSLLAPDTVVKVRFRMKGIPHDIEAEARVAWADRRVGMGLQFTAIGEKARNAIREFVHAHFFTNRKA